MSSSTSMSSSPEDFLERPWRWGLALEHLQGVPWYPGWLLVPTETDRQKQIHSEPEKADRSTDRHTQRQPQTMHTYRHRRTEDHAYRHRQCLDPKMCNGGTVPLWAWFCSDAGGHVVEASQSALRQSTLNRRTGCYWKHLLLRQVLAPDDNHP